MFIDASFRLAGDKIPVDHGYALYSSLSTLLPNLHDSDWLAVYAISGLSMGDGTLRLGKGSRLKLRLPHERLSEVIRLAGKRLVLITGQKESSLRLGIPEVYALQPSPKLYSRCVVIKVSESEKNGISPSREMFLAAIRRKLQEQGIHGEAWIDDKLDSRGREISRRVIRIKGQTIVGYAVQVSNLSPDDSIRLQEIGIGGRRKMGCGIFVPARGE